MSQTDDSLRYYVHNAESADEDLQVLNDYFQLDISCQRLVSEWSKRDGTIAKASECFPGIRILKVDPTETLIAFICSSNNNIPRISLMMNRLSMHYGTLLGVHRGRQFHSFPSLRELEKDGVEANLREMGFGYRAKYVAQAAQYVLRNHGPDWLNSLRDVHYEEAWSALQGIPGVGPKVADCVCLVALGKTEAVPVDTHILQIAVKEYGMKVNGKSLSLKTYKEIGS